MAFPNMSIDQIIERALFLIRNNDKFLNPNVFDLKGNPIRINKLRNFDGFDDNQSGITLSVYPYSYQGTSNETVNSSNAAICYEDLELGTQMSVSRERCRVALTVSLQTVGFNHEIDPSVAGGIIVERSEKESALYALAHNVADMLLTNPINNLGGLIHASKVNWGSFRTTLWENKANAVLHKAVLLWNLELYTVRNWRNFVQVKDLPNVGPTPTWTYVGVRLRDGIPVYFDSIANALVTVSGVLLTLTPNGNRVTWDSIRQLFIDPVSGNPLTPAQLTDPTLVPAGPWIDTDLQIVGVMLPSQKNLFWNKRLLQLQLADGTVITQLDDGRAIHYDPVLGRVILSETSTPIDRPIDNFSPIHTGLVSIYDANGLQLRDQFLF